MDKNPFRKSKDPFPHESKSESTIANEVAELEKMSELQEVDPAAVLKEYGLESNVPINHPYWRVRGTPRNN
jgi:hypothetical protein